MRHNPESGDWPRSERLQRLLAVLKDNLHRSRIWRLEAMLEGAEEQCYEQRRQIARLYQLVVGLVTFAIGLGVLLIFAHFN